MLPKQFLLKQGASVRMQHSWHPCALQGCLRVWYGMVQGLGVGDAKKWRLC
jgi:hypothetical protein